MTTAGPAEGGLGEQLAGWGKVVLVETVGRVSGRPIRVPLGFLAESDGSLLVAATDPDAHWAANLDAEPRCRVTLGDRSWAAVAEPLEGPDRARAVRELILRYGTPSEGLGAGPVYRLVPDRPSDAAGPDGAADAG